MEVSVKNRTISLDTCVLQYLNNSLIEPQLTNLLQTLSRQRNDFRLSDFSTYELFREASKDKESRLDTIWNRFTRYQVDAKVTRFAAQLASAYRACGLGIASIDDGDRIIAATAVVTGSSILTANINDFPRPFFQERHTQEIYYKKKDRKTLLIVYLSEPSYEAIRYYHDRSN